MRRVVEPICPPCAYAHTQILAGKCRTIDTDAAPSSPAERLEWPVSASESTRSREYPELHITEPFLTGLLGRIPVRPRTGDGHIAAAIQPDAAFASFGPSLASRSS
ncbi:MAG: hypothetical protein QOF49_209 [Chloroflexota bacterium]|jgi:hypothetical protein|nr:hypothetical protein [Chloroflexota bacterium]